MTDAELLVWAVAHEPVGSPLAAGILRLLRERDEARRVCDGLAQRVAAQSEVLARMAETQP